MSSSTNWGLSVQAKFDDYIAQHLSETFYENLVAYAEEVYFPQWSELLARKAVRRDTTSLNEDYRVHELSSSYREVLHRAFSWADSFELFHISYQEPLAAKTAKLFPEVHSRDFISETFEGLTISASEEDEWVTAHQNIFQKAYQTYFAIQNATVPKHDDPPSLTPITDGFHAVYENRGEFLIDLQARHHYITRLIMREKTLRGRQDIVLFNAEMFKPSNPFGKVYITELLNLYADALEFDSAVADTHFRK